ncbi:MAG: hypothetical protein PUP46_05235 [Endozoicomonas sp. (ex Botrylloides leachii)]|nr:hypothetical protein [Endozoicomonas sp. (ex Botrylloides leachii)]
MPSIPRPSSRSSQSPPLKSNQRSKNDRKGSDTPSQTKIPSFKDQNKISKPVTSRNINRSNKKDFSIIDADILSIIKSATRNTINNRVDKAKKNLVEVVKSKYPKNPEYVKLVGNLTKANSLAELTKKKLANPDVKNLPQEVLHALERVLVAESKTAIKLCSYNMLVGAKLINANKKGHVKSFSYKKGSNEDHFILCLRQFINGVEDKTHRKPALINKNNQGDVVIPEFNDKSKKTYTDFGLIKDKNKIKLNPSSPYRPVDLASNDKLNPGVVENAFDSLLKLNPPRGQSKSPYKVQDYELAFKALEQCMSTTTKSDEKTIQMDELDQNIKVLANDGVTHKLEIEEENVIKATSNPIEKTSEITEEIIPLFEQAGINTETITNMQPEQVCNLLLQNINGHKSFNLMNFYMLEVNTQVNKWREGKNAGNKTAPSLSGMMIANIFLCAEKLIKEKYESEYKGITGNKPMAARANKLAEDVIELMNKQKAPYNLFSFLPVSQPKGNNTSLSNFSEEEQLNRNKSDFEQYKEIAANTKNAIKPNPTHKK